MTGELRLALLGRPQITRGGRPLTGFVSNKALALLCYLAVTGRAHARPALAGLLWGDTPDASAGTSLRKALSNLRQLAGPHLLITRDEAAFDRGSAYWLDVEVFQTALQRTGGIPAPAGLDETVALYQGDFMDGLYVRDAPDFEDWVLIQRERLKDLAVQAFERLASHHSARHENDAGIDYTRRLLAIEPWREEAHCQLMILLFRGGQRRAALRQYDLCRKILAQELGVEPMAETTALYERLRAAPPAIDSD